jgi:hypothetical protein
MVLKSKSYRFYIRIDKKWDGVKFVCLFEKNDEVMQAILNTKWDFLFEIYRFKLGFSKIVPNS